MDNTITVKGERMAEFVKWVFSLGEDKLRSLVREKLEEISKIPKNVRDKNGFFWDDRMTPNDNGDQYKQGGDCNLCKRKEYCGSQCPCNKLLKRVTMPFLYQLYLDENPEAAVREAAARLTPEQLLEMVGAENAQTYYEPLS